MVRHSSRTRFAVLLAGLVAGCVGVAGCGGGAGAAPGHTTITFWDDNGGADRTPLWHSIIAEFQQQHPTITVNYVGIPASSVQQKYDTAAAGGGLPDVGGVTTAFLADLAGQQALAPLDDRLAGGALSGKLSKSAVDLVKGAGPDGKLYEVPTSENIGMLWYRSDWFSQASLPAPTTWADFYRAVHTLTNASQNRYGYTIRGGAGSIAPVLEEMYAQSGITTIFDKQGHATVDDPRNVAALAKIVGLYGKQTPTADVNNDYTKMVAQYDGGTVAIMHHNLGSYQNQLKAFGKAGATAVPFPAAVNGVHTVVSNPIDGIGVFKSSKNQDAAWQFAQFVGSAETNGKWNQQVGQIPVNLDAAKQSWINDSPPIHAALDVLDDPATEVVQLPYYLPQFNSITKTETEPLYQQVLLGQMSGKDFLGQLAGKLNDAQQQWRQRHGG
jgi:multiple sugar transport system substrate-binding protein